MRACLGCHLSICTMLVCIGYAFSVGAMSSLASEFCLWGCGICTRTLGCHEHLSWYVRGLTTLDGHTLVSCACVLAALICQMGKLGSFLVVKRALDIILAQILESFLPKRDNMHHKSKNQIKDDVPRSPFS